MYACVWLNGFCSMQPRNPKTDFPPQSHLRWPVTFQDGTFVLRVQFMVLGLAPRSEGGPLWSSVLASRSLIYLSLVLHVLWLYYYSLHQAKIGSIIDILPRGAWLSIWDGFSENLTGSPESWNGSKIPHYSASFFFPWKVWIWPFHWSPRLPYIQLLVTRLQRALRESSPQSSIWGMPNGSPGPSWYLFLTRCLKCAVIFVEL